jgi:hypothetical protein
LPPWPFRIEDLPLERVWLWHGEQDHIVPMGAARLLVQVLPHCTATFYPDTGHLSTIVEHGHSILGTLHGTGNGASASA